MKAKTKTSAPIFDALDFPLESFVLFKDGRQWKRVAQDRKALYAQIAKHGETAWPGVNGLMRKTGFSRAKVFRLLIDLKELGCIADATDSKGRKYSGEHGSRVRVVNNGALLRPGQATGWLSFKGAGLLIRVVSGVSNSEESGEEGVSDSSSGVSDSSSGVSNSFSGVSNSASRSLTYGETQKNLQKERTERTERTNPTPKEQDGDGGMDSTDQPITAQDMCELRPTLRLVKDRWEYFWAEYMPAKYPRTHKNQKAEWAKMARRFQTFTNEDYRLLKELLSYESVEELILRWEQFIIDKDASNKSWEDVMFPFRLFARQ